MSYTKSKSDEHPWLPFSFVISGFVISIMWEWFVVPLGVKSIGIAHAIGLSSLVGLMTADTTRKSERRHTGEIILLRLLVWAIVLLVGYIAHCNMVG